jgi:hypothetical protein
LLTALLVVAGCAASGRGGGAGDGEASSSEVLFVGDSNVVLSARQIVKQAKPLGVVPTIVAQSGAATRNDWGVGEIDTDVVVTNLGVNDIVGDRDFDTDIDWFMSEAGDRRVLWSNLPCDIEPPDLVEACEQWNEALSRAARTHDSLEVIDWAAVAEPSHMMAPGEDVHLGTGREVWTELMLSAL